MRLAAMLMAVPLLAGLAAAGAMPGLLLGAADGPVTLQCGALSPLNDTCTDPATAPVTRPPVVSVGTLGFVGHLEVVLAQNPFGDARWECDALGAGDVGVPGMAPLLQLTNCQGPAIDGEFRIPGPPVRLACTASSTLVPLGLAVGPDGSWGCKAQI